MELVAFGVVKALTLRLIANAIPACRSSSAAGIRIADDDEQSAIVLENTASLTKDLNEMPNVAPWVILQPDLASHMIVAKPEIRRRCDDELDRFVRQLAQLGQGIATDDGRLARLGMRTIAKLGSLAGSFTRLDETQYRLKRCSGFHCPDIIRRALAIDPLRILDGPHADMAQLGRVFLANFPQRCGKFQVRAGPLTHGRQLGSDSGALTWAGVPTHHVLIKEIATGGKA